MKLYIQTLGVILGVVSPLVSYAALEEPPVDQQVEMNGEEKPNATPSQDTQQSEGKNLVNEALPRGQLLYENHCHTCHESIIHIRKDHKAKNHADIQYWVGRWAKDLDTKWSADEIDAVVQYLNDTFYHY
jgi:cytochrome c5